MPRVEVVIEVDVVVSGSEFDNRFLVVDFTDRANPSAVFVNAPWPPWPPGSPSSGGCLVDCSVTLAAVAHYTGSEVAIYDITNPAAPALKSTFDSGLGSGSGLTGIGAVSLDGTNLLVGELAGPNVVLIDVSDPSSPSVVSMISNTGADQNGITGLAISGSFAVATVTGGFLQIDYTTPTAPVPLGYAGNTHFQDPLACGFDGTTAAIADGGTTFGPANVYLFQIGNPGPLYVGQAASPFGGLTSVTVRENLVAASTVGVNSVWVTEIETQSPPGSETSVGSFPPVPGGAVKFSPPAPRIGVSKGKIDPGGPGSIDVRGGTIAVFDVPVLVSNAGGAVAWLEISKPSSPTVLGTDSSAALAVGLRPTIGLTYFDTVIWVEEPRHR